MGKIPTIAIIAIVVVLVIGISVAAFYFLIKPKQEELAGLKEKLAAEQAVVAQKATAEAEFAAVNASWLQAQQELASLRERKSIPISMYMPLLAMTSMWYELREDLPKVVTNYLVSQGVTIQSGASMPAPQLAPPTVPASGFLQVPEGQSLTLAVTGTLANIKKVYSNLAQMPRIATIGALNLTGTGERLTATFPMSLYIIVEGAEAAAPPPAAAAAPGGAPGAPEAGAPPSDGGGGEEGGKKGEDKSSEEDSGGKSKGGDGGGGDE